MRRDLPSRLQPVYLSQDTTLTTQNVHLDGLFVVSVSGLTVTLPGAQESIEGAECIVVNDSSGQLSISCIDGFPNDTDSVTLAAGESCMLYCAPVSGNSYRWAAIGATVS